MARPELVSVLWSRYGMSGTETVHGATRQDMPSKHFMYLASLARCLRACGSEIASAACSAVCQRTCPVSR
eukprot:603770-Rhodomonas_salina.4